MRAPIVLALISSFPAFAQNVYTWEDADGFHATDDRSQVPKNVLVDIERMEDPAPAVHPATPVPVVTPTAATAPAPASPRLDEATWRDRFVESQRRITELKQTIQALNASLPPRMECTTYTPAQPAPGTVNTGAPLQPVQRCQLNPVHDRIRVQLAKQEVALQLAESDAVRLEREASYAGVPREWRRGW